MSHFRCLAFLNLALLLAVPAARAQSILAPPAPTPLTPPAMLSFETNRLGTLPPPATASSSPEETPLRWGPLSLRPHVLYRFLYGDGIPAAPTQQVVTVINELSPGLLIGLGSHFTLDYTPTWRFYSNNRFRDSLDHNVILTGGTVYENWVLGLSQTYSLSSLPLVETGTQTTEEDFITALDATYQFNTKLSAELTAHQTFASPEQFAGHREWSTLDWLNYQIWPRLTAGVGAGFGYVDVDAGSNARYEQGMGRIAWRVTDKLAFQLRGGVEDRQFLGDGAGDAVNPLFGGSIQYQPFDHTALSISVERLVAASYFTNQFTENTTLSATLEQRLFEKLYLSLGGGYSNIKYDSSAADLSVNRKDDYYFFNVRLSVPILKRGTIALLYQYSDDTSNQPGTFSFSSSQVGLELGYKL